MKMNLLLKATFLAVFFLSACGPQSDAPSQGSIETAIAQTQTAVTSTPIPLSDIDLKLILIPSEKIPKGYFATKTKDSVPFDVPEPLKMIWQQLETENGIAGGVRIYLYESKLDVKSAYEIELEINKRISTFEVVNTDVGEKAELTSFLLNGNKTTDFVFMRCFAVVSIRMVNMFNENDIIDYAKLLDVKIQDNICR